MDELRNQLECVCVRAYVCVCMCTVNGNFSDKLTYLLSLSVTDGTYGNDCKSQSMNIKSGLKFNYVNMNIFSNAMCKLVPMFSWKEYFTALTTADPHHHQQHLTFDLAHTITSY